MRVGGETWQGRVDFTRSVHCVAAVGQKASKLFLPE